MAVWHQVPSCKTTLHGYAMLLCHVSHCTAAVQPWSHDHVVMTMSRKVVHWACNGHHDGQFSRGQLSDQDKFNKAPPHHTPRPSLATLLLGVSMLGKMHKHAQCCCVAYLSRKVA